MKTVDLDDDNLIDDAIALGHHVSAKQAVTEALREYVAKKRGQEFIALFGTVDYLPDYDYKAERKRA